MQSNKALENYIIAHTTPESELRATLGRSAHVRLIRPRMLSGHLQGSLLRMLVQISGARRILEVGTYSGYAAHCMAEVIGEEGEVHTIECDDEMEEFIREYIDQAPYGNRIKLHMGDAICIIPQLVKRYQFDLVYLDANKREYPDYYRLLIPHLRSGCIILADNTLWDGKVVEPVRSSDTQTQAILEFNRMVQEDARVENLILPLRDGLSVIRVL